MAGVCPDVYRADEDSFSCSPTLGHFRSIQMEPMTLQDIWIAFQSAHLPLPLGVESVLGQGGQETLRPDNPFLINYVFHHHYRSLGWVVKNGIKFCVDYLLYKRGPVFHHAE